MADLKVLVSDSIDKICVAEFEKRGCKTTFQPGMGADELLREIHKYDGLIVRSATKVTADVLRAATRLRVVGRAGSGIDNIDVQAASDKNIAVLSTPGANTISAAEQTFALMIALARNIPAAHISMRDGKWSRSEFSGVELFNKTLGIVGLGQIGKEVAGRSKAFGMRVISFDPVAPDENFEKSGVQKVDFEELIRSSDFITLHVPLNEHTRNLISEAQFNICKPDLRIINVSRGGVIDENALFHALQAGKLAGAALDVFEHEPPDDYRFSSFSNVITTPHLGASTIDAQLRVAVEVAQSAGDYLLGKKVLNVVNASQID